MARIRLGVLMCYLLYLCALITGETTMPSNYEADIGEAVEFRCTTTMSDWASFHFKRHTAKPDITNPIYLSEFKDVIYVGKDGTYKETTEDDFLKSRLSYRKVVDGGETVFVVRIHSLDCGDAGLYQCHVTGMRMQEARTELVLKAPPLPPVIRSLPEEKDENDRFSLTCEGNVGLPSGNLTWYEMEVGRSGKSLLSPTNKTSRMTGCRGYKTSKIDIVALPSKHNAKYFCYASRPRLTPTTSKLMAIYELKIKGMSVTTPDPRAKSKSKGTGGGGSLHFSLVPLVFSLITAPILAVLL